MSKTDCLKLIAVRITTIIMSVFVLTIITVGIAHGAGTDTINVEGKIVRNDAGHEGMNVTTGTPACVVAGNSNDTCDFRVRYYSSTTGGTLYLTETFQNIEIGQYGGGFNISLGSGTATAGTYSNLSGMVKGEDMIYMEISFSPAGDGTYTETFGRMPLQSSAYAIRSKYSSGASSAFQFAQASSSSGYSNPTAGMVYFDTTTNTLKIYNGSSWEKISSGAAGTSLWSDGGTYTYLTDTADSFSLGSSSYTAIGTKSYADYILGITSNPVFSFDMPTDRLSVWGDKKQTGLTVLSSYASTDSWPLVTFQSNSANYASTILNVVQGGTGKIATFYKGSTEAFTFGSDQTFLIGQRTGVPSSTSDRLYNVGGVLYWNGSSICTLASGCGVTSLWSDAGTYTYLKSTSDNLVLGGDSLATAKFFFDVANGRLGIGTSSPTAKLDIAGDNSVIKNTFGDLTIMPAESLVVRASDTNPDNLQEWQNSLGAVLALINGSGYASFGGAGTGNSVLSLGGNTGGLSQVNLESSGNIDVLNPGNGDLWWNGTELYFFDGNRNTNLLTGHKEEYIAYGLVNDSDYLSLSHNQNTYAMEMEGYVCVGGEYDANCTGGQWKDISEWGKVVTDTGYLDWYTADKVSSNVNVNTGDIQLGSNSTYGMYVSEPIKTTGAKGYGDISWTESLGSTGKVSVQTRSGDTETKPYEYTIDGTVYAQELSPDGKTLYIGGDFTSIGGESRNSIAALDTTTGSATDFNPAGEWDYVYIYTMVLSGTTLYVGGQFTSIGGESRNCIAAIDTTTGLVTDFNPNAGPYGVIYALALSGSTLYVGGQFTSIGGQSRNNIAAVDTTTGLVTDFNPNAGPYGVIYALALSGSTLYVGGEFGSIGGESRNCIAAIDTATGNATSFNPNANGYVYTLLLSGNTLYVGGYFTSIGGESRNCIAAIDTTTGLVTDFNPAGEGNYVYIRTMVLSGSTLYVGGSFTSIGGQSRNGIAAIDITTGLATTFNPAGENDDVYIHTMVLSDCTLYVGGEFESIGGQSRSNIAALDVTTSQIATYTSYIWNSWEDSNKVNLNNADDHTAWNVTKSPYEFTTDGTVYAQELSPDGKTLYIGGEFTSVYDKYYGSALPVDITTGKAVSERCPTINGTVNLSEDMRNGIVNTAIEDGSGGWYIGGSFTSVGSITRNGIAHINSDCSLDMSFNPDINLNGYGGIYTLLLSGSTLYVGGIFISIDDNSRNGIAALDITTGLTTDFNPNADGYTYVYTMVLSGSTLYVGGSFSNIGGESRNGIAALDITSGLVTDFNPNVSGDIFTMVLSGSTLYVGGVFTSIGGESRNGIAALDITTGTATSFNPNANGSVWSLLLSGSTLYVGGTFSNIGGESRNGIAALDTTSGLATGFNPNAAQSTYTGHIYTMVLSGSTLYVGGEFTSIGGQGRNSIAALDTTTGLATDFNSIASHVYTMVLSGSTLYVGGEFTSVGGHSRNGIAAIDTTSGLTIDFNPNVSGVVRALFLSGSTLYVGGEFASVGGQSRNSIAAIDTITGLTTEFNPNANNRVSTMVLSGSTLYVGGGFTSIGGQSRNCIAALDTTTGSATDFNPAGEWDYVYIYTMVLSGTTLYVGGEFNRIGGQSRNNIAAVDITTGLATDFNPNANRYVNTIFLSGDTLYVGGRFTSIGGQTRNRIAAIDTSTGLATDFNANASGNVYTMALSGSTLYVGGGFTSIGGQSRNCIAALDTATGNATSFNPNANGYVYTLLLSGNTLYVGGYFTSIGGQSRNGIAAIDTSTGLVPTAGNFEGDILRTVKYFEDENESDPENITKITVAPSGYAQSDISAVNLSNYDYITLWVYSNQVGPSLRISIGEDTSNLRNNDIKIDASNTWQKIYWDISGIPKAERDGITTLRITNLSSSSNTFYIDNISAELLPTDSNGYEIQNSGDDYIQYRIIFTNTDGTSQPKVEEVSLNYNTDYDLENADLNTTKLYNGSGSTQYLKIKGTKGDTQFISNIPDKGDAVAFSFNTTNSIINENTKLFSVNNSGTEKMYIDAYGNIYITGEVISGGMHYLKISPTSSQIDDISNSNSIWINKTSTGGNLVKLQNNSTDMFVVSNGGDVTTQGTVEITGGILKLGNNGNIRYNNGSGEIEMSKDGGSTWVKVGGNNGKIVISAEYDGSVFKKDGTNNIGNMTSGNTGSTNNSMNYYEWTSSESTLNDMDIKIRFTLPSDFGNWGSSGITVHYATESISALNNNISLYLYRQGISTADSQRENLISNSAGAWNTISLPASEINECVDSGTTCILDIKLSSLSDNYVRVGNIVLEYVRML